MMRAWLDSFKGDVFSDWSADNDEDSDRNGDFSDGYYSDRSPRTPRKRVDSETRHLMRKKKIAVDRYIKDCLCKLVHCSVFQALLVTAVKKEISLIVRKHSLANDSHLAC